MHDTISKAGGAATNADACVQAPPAEAIAANQARELNERAVPVARGSERGLHESGAAPHRITSSGERMYLAAANAAPETHVPDAVELVTTGAAFDRWARVVALAEQGLVGVSLGAVDESDIACRIVAELDALVPGGVMP